MKTRQIKIEEKISESNSTAVYRAFDDALQRNVLLKVLHKHLANDSELRERFIREARACAAIRSEHIVQVYDLTENDGAPAIIMEFVEGKSLKEGIAEGQCKGFDFARTTAVHVLRALLTAHKQKIIHRDIKPGNILVSNDGTLKVTDFGLAYVAMSPTVTVEGMVLGTPAYMSPEQIRGEEVDERTDLFALGATVVEVLTGERIFEGSTYTECMKKILAFKEPELNKLALHSSNDFVSFLQKLMHPKKEARFASAGEALSAIGEKKSSTRLHLEMPLRTRKRYGIPAAAGAMMLALLVVFGWLKLSEKKVNEQPFGKNNEHSAAHISDSSRVENGKRAAVQSKPEKESPAVLRKDLQRNSAVKDSGKILLTSNPWAKVYVNNLLIGETPMAKQVTLAAGTHTIMFTNPFFDPIIKTVRVEPNKEVTVVGNFLENIGYLVCTAVPWADVYVDEQYKDTTPLSKPLMLTAGKHSIRFKNSAFEDVVRETTIAAQDTVKLSVEFTK